MILSPFRESAPSKLFAMMRAHKLPFLLAMGTLVIFFGGTLLSLFGHGVILCLEVLELLFEHFVESVFEVSPRTAQVITAWTGLLAFLVLLLETSKRLATAMSHLWAEATLVKARVNKRLHR